MPAGRFRPVANQKPVVRRPAPPPARRDSPLLQTLIPTVSRAASRTVKKTQTPVFRHEGPQLYHAAYQRNRRFAKPGPYQTKLNPQVERFFRAWVAARSVPFNVKAPVVDYDMRGFYKSTRGQGWNQGSHFPDTYKTPYDTTFSSESEYATPNNPLVWRGNKLINRQTGQVIFG